MRAGFVQIEDGPVFPCMLADEDWNGFAVPYFDAYNARKLAEHYGDFEEDEVVFVHHDGAWLYSVGGWIWTEVEG